MGTRDLTHKAIAEALSNDRLLTHDQRAALLTLVADDSVWQRKHDEAAAEVTRLVDKCNSYIVDNARLAEQVESLRAEVAQARETAEYWKAEHLAGNARIGELHDELAATALRSADYLRKAIKAEAEVALLRAALNGGNAIERLQFALQRLADATEALGVNNFGEDWRSDEVQELQAATHAARLVLGPNVRAKAAATAAQEAEDGTK